MLEMKKLKKALSEDVMIVTFRKKNGDIREMHCTTNPKSIPMQFWPKTHIENESSIRVYDVEKKEWRSFIYANVVSVKKRKTTQEERIISVLRGEISPEDLSDDDMRALEEAVMDAVITKRQEKSSFVIQMEENAIH